MPDMLAHYDVAEAARARLAPGRLSALLDAAPDAYAVGAQGPDFLFYADVRPGRRGSGDLAFPAHQRRTGEAFGAMLRYASAAPAAERAALYAYVCGHAAHVCLDAAAHPWILYWTGDVSGGTGSDDAARAMRRHGILEASIDVMLAGRHRPPGFRGSRSRGLLSLNARRRQAVARLWSSVLRDVHGVSFPERRVDAAFRDMALVYGSMTDRRSPLSLILRAGGRRLDPRGLLRTQIYPAAPHPAAAMLLGSRREWRSPALPGEPRTETFAELCDQAVAHTVACLRAVEGVVVGDESVESAVAVVGDRNLITGVPCGDPAPLAAFAPDREGLWGDT